MLCFTTSHNPQGEMPCPPATTTRTCPASRPPARFSTPLSRKDRRPHAAPRPSRSVILPEIVRLSLEGHSSRAISRKTAVPRQTVDRWLWQQRQEWAQSRRGNRRPTVRHRQGPAGIGLPRGDGGLRDSLAGKQTTAAAAGNDGDGKADPVRRTTQSGQASLLGKAVRAAVEIAKFHAKHVEAARRAKTAKRRRARRILADEIASLPQPELADIKEMLRDFDCFTARHNPDEVANILCELSPAEFRKLRALLRLDYNVALPRRRTAVPEVPDETTEGEGMRDEG